jgi:hypothetical protein
VNRPLDPVDGKVNITLDGTEPMFVEMSFSVEGAEGIVNSAEPFTITFLEKIQFHEPDSAATPTYAFDGSTEFVGGDEPWENEFIGGDEPWENEFIGDDPWDNRVDMKFEVFAPPDWEFDTTDWPSGLGNFVNQEGNELRMEGAEVRDEFNSTFGQLDTLVIKEVEEEVDIVPKSISIVAELERVNLMTLNITGVYVGENAHAMREMMNYFLDETITQDEVDTYVSYINGPLEVVDTDVNITLDGMEPSDVMMSFGVEGAVGPANSPEELKITFLETVLFPEVDTSMTHTYGFDEAEEFVGGDEPWDNEFVGGDEPWDDEFVGGDEPWDNRVDMQFSFIAPEDWEFDQTNWPSGLSDYLGLDARSIEMDGLEVRSNYNTTFGALDALVIGMGPAIVQSSIIIEVDISAEERMLLTITGTFEGTSAFAMRMLFDSNYDGTVSASEVSDYLTDVNAPLDVIDTNVPITLDGRGPESVEMSFSVEGAEGEIESTEPFKIVFIQTLRFTLPEDSVRKTHTYDFTGAEEWVGGDEPWDDEFVGGDEPWDDEFVGGDEPWDNRVDVQFSIRCPDGWTFKSGDWPETMKDFLNKDGTEINLDDAAVKGSYNSTIGSQDTLVIKKEDGGDSPGFGLIIAILAVATATFSIIRGRRR